jgi:hypothetical protein
MDRFAPAVALLLLAAIAVPTHAQERQTYFEYRVEKSVPLRSE